MFSMLNNAAKLALVALTLTFAIGLSIVGAKAQQIDPKCAKFNFRDKIGCTCAVQNGGAIVPRSGGGWRWVSRIGHRQVNEGFVQCMRRNGRG
jgi:hypothetical protein